MRGRTWLAGALWAAALAWQAAPAQAVVEGDMPLDKLQELQLDRKAQKKKGTEMRLDAMRTEALRVGASHAFVHRMRILQAYLERHAVVWDKLFDFSALMRMAAYGEAGSYILPAAVRLTTGGVVVDPGNEVVRVDGEAYEIVRRAEVVGGPPNWRSYLVMDLSAQLGRPDEALLPAKGRERKMWREWVAEGWEAGLNQADLEMRGRIGRLGMEYAGMVRYLRLVLEGRITPPSILSETDTLTSDIDSMIFDRTVHRIASGAAFQPDPEHWSLRPLPVRDDEGLGTGNATDQGGRTP